MIAKLCQWIGAATLIVILSEFLADKDASWLSRSKNSRRLAAGSNTSRRSRSYALTPADGGRDKDRAYRLFSKN